MKLDHIGVVVRDLDQACTFLSQTFGLELDRTAEAPDRQIRVAFFNLGPAQIELLEVGDPESRAQRLGDAEARVEHIAVEVDDVDATLAELRAKGVQSQQDEPELRGGRRAFFTRPESSGGVIYQFLEN